jgi:hypothetical protein
MNRADAVSIELWSILPQTTSVSSRQPLADLSHPGSAGISYAHSTLWSVGGMKAYSSHEIIEWRIFLIRGHKVTLDSDLAGLYGA